MEKAKQCGKGLLVDYSDSTCSSSPDHENDSDATCCSLPKRNSEAGALLTKKPDTPDNNSDVTCCSSAKRNSETGVLVTTEPNMPDKDSDYSLLIDEPDIFSGSDSDVSWNLPVKKKRRRPVFTFERDCAGPSTSANVTDATIACSTSDSSNSAKESESSAEDTNVVGKRGLKKKRPLPKKLKEKSERWSGKGKSVKPNPCTGKKCGNDCANKFTEIERHYVHELYWGLGSLQRQRDWILSCIKETTIGRKRAESDRRKTSYYYLKVLILSKFANNFY